MQLLLFFKQIFDYKKIQFVLIRKCMQMYKFKKKIAFTHKIRDIHCFGQYKALAAILLCSFRLCSTWETRFIQHYCQYWGCVIEYLIKRTCIVKYNSYNCMQISLKLQLIISHYFLCLFSLFNYFIVWYARTFKA